MTTSPSTRALALRLAHLASVALALAVVGPTVRADDGPIEFNRDIRPLLADKCFACHGPDKNKREADLRLDTRQGLLGEGDQAGTVRPGKPDDSELWRRIVSDDADERMPPADSGKELSPGERALLRRWIEQGAPWEGHWSLQPIRRPTPPEVAAEDAPFLRSPLDAFVLARLKEHGLRPSPEADKRTLIRRLSFDLLGLPPTPEEVEAFVNDSRPEAYEALVDRLLESPHYGERMAMWWLDLVRYADSVGYHGDQPVSIFPFRDYVIGSFNENLPFDRFTLEQLAGDLLPEPTFEQKIASGYNRLGMMSAEGGVQPKEYLAKYIAERVRNLGGVWLGMTTGCCECHDHKYDPLTMDDFYSLEAFFADIQERGLYSGANSTGDWGPRVQVPTAAQRQRLEELDAQLADLRRQLDTDTPELVAAREQWERSLISWTVLVPEKLESANGATLAKQDDNSVLASGTSPASDTYTLTIPNPPAGVTALRLEVLPHDSLPKKGPGRAGNGNFVLTELVARLTPAGEQAEPQPLKIAAASASYEQTGAAGDNPYGKWAVAAAIDNDAQGEKWGWAIMEQAGQANFAIFELEAPLAGGEGTTLVLELRQGHDNPNHTLGRFRLLATTAPRPIPQSDNPPPSIATILAVSADQRTEAQRNELATHYRSIAPTLAEARARRDKLDAERKQLDGTIATSLVTVAVEPRMVRRLPRGNWMDDSGPEMKPRFPTVLTSTSASVDTPAESAGDRRLNRADLARWLTSPEHPLTARVFVNRVWKLFFGAGLSRKLDDIGSQGEWPSHPELLDSLAGEFIDSGWDVKRLVKRIVMSGTYRQSSAESAQQREADPFNRWLGRQSRFRLDAEMVRDNALRASGLLVESIGGGSVNPYQPRGYWSYLNFPAREWQNGKGEELYRRGMYTHWQRQYLHPSLLAFDAPSREECAADRPRSNTPLQSLVLFNDPTYVEAARSLAERAYRAGGDDDARLAALFRWTLSRPYVDREREILEGLLAKHRAGYQEDSQAAAELLKVGDRPAPADIAAPELAAWTNVARAVLMLHETITRE